MKKLFLFCLLFSIGSYSFCQKKTDIEKLNDFYLLVENDSLQESKNYEQRLIAHLTLANKHENWDYALRFTNKLANYYIYKNIAHKKADSILKIFTTSLKKCTDKKEIGDFYINYIESLIYNHQQKKAFTFLTGVAIPYFEKEQDSSSYNFAYSYLKAGEVSTALSKVSESVNYFKKAEKLFTKQKDTLFLLWTKNGLSTLFSDNGLYDEAAQERETIYLLAPKINKEQVAAMARIRATMDAQFLGNTELALHHTREGLKNKYNDSSLKEIVNFLTLSFAVSTYAQEQKIDSSNYYKKRLDVLAKKHTENPFLLGYYQTASAYNSFANKDYVSAQKKLLNLYESKESGRLLEVEYLLAKTYENLENTDKSLFHYKKYTALKDSINRSNSKRRFAYAKTVYETEKKDLQIKNQKSEILLLDVTNKQKNRFIVFGTITLLGLFLTIYLFRSRKFAVERQKKQAQLTQNLLIGQEEERTRLSRELHDGIGQKLILLKIKSQNNKQSEISELTGTVLNDIRNISRALHPAVLENLGLTEAIKAMINNVDEKTELFFTVDVENIDAILSKENELNLYRFVQESINNTVKHSQATAVLVEINKTNKNILIKIEDNGKGFDVAKKLRTSKSLGLKTMSERIKMLKGELFIDSEKNSPTKLNVKIPI